MQPRLTRSNTETMVAGVCGGLAEYFSIDPVIVRLIFILLTFTSGIGLPIYAVLWMIMPKANGQAQQSFQQGLQQFGQEASQFGQEAARIGREVLVGQRQGQSQARGGSTTTTTGQPEYRFDPLTGQPIDPNAPNMGQTVNLYTPPAQLPQQYDSQAPRRPRNWGLLGLILIGIGGMIVLEQIGINMGLVFPVLMIAAGLILLRRKR